MFDAEHFMIDDYMSHGTLPFVRGSWARLETEHRLEFPRRCTVNDLDSDLEVIDILTFFFCCFVSIKFFRKHA